MAKRAARRPTARRAPARPPRRPGRRPAAKAAPPRPPLISADQRRELSGIGLLGAGIVVAVVLAIPGGGSIASPIHDGLFGLLGVGAWLVAAGLALTGVRLLAAHRWRGGVLAAAGSLLVVLAVLGIAGLAADGSAGWVGRQLADATAARLGGAATAAALAVIGVAGLVLAVDLRMVAVADWARARWRRRSETRALQRAAADRQREAEMKLLARAQSRRRVPVAATAVRDAVTPDLPLQFQSPPAVPRDEPKAAEPEPEPPVAEADAPAPNEVAQTFVRDFEGVTVAGDAEPGDAPPTAPDDLEARSWTLPSVELLDVFTGKRERLEQEVKVTAETIVDALHSFGIETRVVDHHIGPTVTQYEVQPARGVPVKRIEARQTDLSLALAAPVSIQPFIPGKSVIGIEVPNKAAQLVTLRDIVSGSHFTSSKAHLAVALGADVSGHPVVGDLTRMPHMLIAGATGSGKSVCLNAILAGFMLRLTPAQLKMILIDPKRVELSQFADLPHLLVPVVVDSDAAVASLRWAVKEMEDRYKLFASHGARNIVAFNERAPQLGLDPLPYTVIVIDELADLMMVAAGEIEDLVCRIAQLARAVGIHLIVATQRPSADIITGLIKANIPSRVAFAVSSGTDSRVILDTMGAEKLLGRGDMLYLPIDEGRARRLQGAFVSDRELEALIDHWKQQGRPDYQEQIFTVEATTSWARDASKRDPLFAKAAHTVAAEGRAAASLLQRKLGVGYTRAARLIDQLAEHRVVGPFEGSKSRDVLMGVLEVDELLRDLGDE